MKRLLLLSLILLHTTLLAQTQVIIKTTMGDIEIELFDKKSKESVRNFLQYVDEGFYTDMLFHRVIKDYIIQAGRLDTNFQEKKTHPQIKNDALNMVKNLKGTIAMARGRHKHSAKSEFYLNLKDNPALDHSGLANYGFAVFGKITKGFEVALKIGEAPVTKKDLYNKVPTEPIIIKSIVRK